MPKERHHPHQLHPVSDLALLATPEHRDRSRQGKYLAKIAKKWIFYQKASGIVKQ